MYSINNIIYMYTIINVMLFSFSRFERVSNAEQTEQSNSTLASSYYCIYHFAFEFVYKWCFLFGSCSYSLFYVFVVNFVYLIKLLYINIRFYFQYIEI